MRIELRFGRAVNWSHCLFEALVEFYKGGSSIPERVHLEYRTEYGGGRPIPGGPTMAIRRRRERHDHDSRVMSSFAGYSQVKREGEREGGVTALHCMCVGNVRREGGRELV